MSDPTFDFITDALDAGYERPWRGHDRDVSGPNSYGYAYERDGRETVTVWFRREKNNCETFLAMFPPEADE